eukprot:scaffold80902_cov69-Phaeocystis_antarctica.AAC.2
MSFKSEKNSRNHGVLLRVRQQPLHEVDELRAEATVGGPRLGLSATGAVAALPDAVDDRGDEQREENRLERVEELEHAERHRGYEVDEVGSRADGTGLSLGEVRRRAGEDARILLDDLRRLLLAQHLDEHGVRATDRLWRVQEREQYLNVALCRGLRPLSSELRCDILWWAAAESHHQHAAALQVVCRWLLGETVEAAGLAGRPLERCERRRREHAEHCDTGDAPVMRREIEIAGRPSRHAWLSEGRRELRWESISCTSVHLTATRVTDRTAFGALAHFSRCAGYAPHTSQKVASPISKQQPAQPRPSPSRRLVGCAAPPGPKACSNARKLARCSLSLRTKPRVRASAWACCSSASEMRSAQ